MKVLRLAALAVLVAVGLAPGAALAARNDITVGMVLEPQGSTRPRATPRQPTK